MTKGREAKPAPLPKTWALLDGVPASSVHERASAIARVRGAHCSVFGCEPVTALANYVRRQVTDIIVLDSDRWREIREIRLRALSDAPDAFTSTVDRESAYDEEKWRTLATTGRWFVADDEGLVGVAVGVPGWSGDPSKRELVGMWVAPSHRRLGVARMLLQAVKGWAASEGAATLGLGVREGNDQAISAYMSLGMRPSGETMLETGEPTQRILLMECDLVSA